MDLIVAAFLLLLELDVCVLVGDASSEAHSEGCEGHASTTSTCQVEKRREASFSD